MGVSINGGTQKWLVYKENPTKIDDLGVPLFQETPILCNHPHGYLGVYPIVRKFLDLNLGEKKGCDPI